MKQRAAIVLGALSILLLTLGVGTGYGYTVDGMLDDWGMDISVPAANVKGYLNTNLPSGATANAVTEDNADKYTEWTYVGPQWTWYNHFDAEAMYLDNDHTNAYVAVVTGLRQAGVNPPGNAVGGNDAYAFKPGDIGIDVDGDHVYEFGIDIDTGMLMKVTSWKTVYYDPTTSPANPYMILAGYDAISVPFVYSAEQNTHYVLETAIPLSYLGVDNGDTMTVHWSMECGNDYLNLDGTVHTPVPAPLLLLGSGLVGVVALSRRRLFGR